MVDMNLTIDYNGAPAVVEFQELNYGQLIEVVRKLGLNKGKITPTGIEVSELDWTVLIDEILTKSIKSAPFPINLDSIHKLSPNIVIQLATKAMEVNPFQFGL